MRPLVLNTLLLATSLLGYLEWGKEQHLFLAQAEYEILIRLFSSPKEVLHPFVILPLAGQLSLIIALFVKKWYKFFTRMGIILIAVLLLFIFLIGLIGLNWKLLLSTVPFLTLSIYSFIATRKSR